MAHIYVYTNIIIVVHVLKRFQFIKGTANMTWVCRRHLHCWAERHYYKKYWGMDHGAPGTFYIPFEMRNRQYCRAELNLCHQIKVKQSYSNSVSTIMYFYLHFNKWLSLHIFESYVFFLLNQLPSSLFQT